MPDYDENDSCEPCGASCESVFDRVVVSHVTKGNSRVMWELLSTFTDPGPLTFQLQAGATNNPGANDWVDVGLPVQDRYFAYDPEQRDWGVLRNTNYRVILSTPIGTYYSEPTGGLGVLEQRDWVKAQDIVRRKKLMYRVGHSAQRGYLLKRRWGGERCPCRDPMLQESRNPDCPLCYGTGYRCGYYYPMSCVWFDGSLKSRRIERDNNMVRGQIGDLTIKGEVLASYLMAEEDVWISAKTDDRYFIHRVDSVTEIRGIPVVASVTASQIPYTSPIYGIAIPDELKGENDA